MTPDYSVQSKYGGRLSLAGLWLTVEEVIHHDDVLIVIIIRARRRIAGCDADSCDKRLVEDNAEKRKTRITRRSRDETTEQNFAIDAKIFD